MTKRKQKVKRGRGRPAGSGVGSTPRRSIRISDEDWERINDLAKRKGETASEYMRRRGLGE